MSQESVFQKKYKQDIVLYILNVILCRMPWPIKQPKQDNLTNYSLRTTQYVDSLRTLG